MKTDISPQYEEGMINLIETLGDALHAVQISTKKNIFRQLIEDTSTELDMTIMAINSCIMDLNLYVSFSQEPKPNLEESEKLLEMDKKYVEEVKTIIHNTKVLNNQEALEINSNEIETEEELIGTGSFGDIYKGYYRGQEVALKVLKITKSEADMLQREVKALSLLRDCNNIISLYGFKMSKNEYTIVMEFADNRDLYNYLYRTEKFLTDKNKYNIILGIANGIAFIHKLGLVHRDLKSPNILLDKNLCPKITDFGVVKLPTKSLLSTLSKSHQSLLGSVHWKAPEIFEGFENYTSKSDIYAYSIIIWEIVHRKMPYGNEESDEIRYKVKNGMRERFGPKEGQGEYRALVEVCWNQDPNRRYGAERIIKYLLDMKNRKKHNFEEMCKDAMESNNSVMIYNLGYMYQCGTCVIQNYDKARELYEKAASIGNSNAMTSLGLMYKRGEGVPQDYNKARKLYERAILAENSSAMNNLAAMYKNGEGVVRNYNKAKELYHKAALAKNSNAMNSLGYMYQHGEGVTKNYGKARELYERAISTGNGNAMNNLGHMYQYGEGVAQSYDKAKELYEKAILTGNSMAMYSLGHMYQHGEGSVQNYDKARELYERAIELGNTIAMYSLGLMYKDGEGVAQNYDKAKELYKMAKSHRIG